MSELFNLPFEPLEINIDIIDSFTLRPIKVSLFVSTSHESSHTYPEYTKYTSQIMLFDSFNRAYESFYTYCHYEPMTASYWKHRLHISSLSLRNKVNYKMTMVSKKDSIGLLKLCTWYPVNDIDMNTMTFTLCPQLCKKNITDAALLQKMEEDYYPYVVTGLKKK